MVASDCYAILGVSATATEAEIKKAYKKKALQYHPDKNPSTTAEETFKEINRAYATLSDVDKRRVYDLQRDVSTSSTTATKSAPQQRKTETSFKTSFHEPGQPHFTFTSSTKANGPGNASNSPRFRFHRMGPDPFAHFHHRPGRFSNSFFDPFRTRFRSHDFSFFDSTSSHISSDNDDDDIDDGIGADIGGETERNGSTLGSDDFDFDSTSPPPSSQQAPPPHRSGHAHFTTKTRPKWNNSWPFDTDEDNKSSTSSNHKFSSAFQQRSNADNSFMMFEMLTRAVFDKFFNDDLFWSHFDMNDPSTANAHQGVHFPDLNPQQSSRTASTRLRNSSQQRPPTSTNRSRIDINHMPTSPRKNANEMHFEWMGHHPKQKRTTPSRFGNRDSDEENIEETYVYRERKPTTVNVQRLRRRHMNDHESKIQSCQFCFEPMTSIENRLQHESICRLRPTKTSTTNYRNKIHPTTTSATNTEKLFITKCSFCHQDIRLTDRIDHEALCKQFGPKRQSTANSSSKHFNSPTSKNINNDSQFPPNSASGNLSNGIEQLRTCNRCHQVFSVLSDLFHHICDDEEEDLFQTKPRLSSLNKQISDNKCHNNTTSSDNSFLFHHKSPSTQESSPRPFKLNRRSSFKDSPINLLRSTKSTSTVSPSPSPIIRLTNNTSPIDSTNIPTVKRTLFQPNTSSVTYTSSSSSSSSSPQTRRTSFNDKQNHLSSAYIYIRNMSSPIRVMS